MRPDVLWTNLSKEEIARRLKDMGTPASPKVVQQLLDQHDIGQRKALKSEPMGQHQDRDAQFQNIAALKQQYLDSPNPILSIDTKKRELLGNFFRSGTLYTQQAASVFDHDFPSFASGAVIPHGLYDYKRNRGYINLGTSHDTSQFACDSIEQWWRAEGQAAYPQARSLLLLCDGGGSNSASHNIFKQDLQSLADRIGLEIRVAHYPPYLSKYNPIEHRMFPHVSRACQGLIFTTAQQVRHYMAQAKTTTGLKVVANLMDKVYVTGRKVADDFKKTMRITFDQLLPKWNYRAIPATT